MMFADDIVFFSERTEQVEENLEGWRFVLEGRGMKVNMPLPYANTVLTPLARKKKQE